VVGAASSEPVFGNLARDYGVSTQAGNHNAIQRRHLNAAEMARETGHRVTVAVPTNSDSCARRHEMKRSSGRAGQYRRPAIALEGAATVGRERHRHELADQPRCLHPGLQVEFRMSWRCSVRQIPCKGGCEAFGSAVATRPGTVNPDHVS
jgi:hypothetical protein